MSLATAAQIAMVNDFVFPLYGGHGTLSIDNLCYLGIGFRKTYSLARGFNERLPVYVNDTALPIRYNVDGGETKVAQPGERFTDPFFEQ